MRVAGIPVDIDVRQAATACARGLWPFKRIVVGLKWYALPVDQRVAVLYHEAGHCRLFHLEKRILALPLLLVAPRLAAAIARRHELASDRYAAQAGFAAPHIAYLEEAHADDSDFYPSREERISSLRAYLEGEPC